MLKHSRSKALVNVGGWGYQNSRGIILVVTVAGLGVKPTYPLLVVFANESGALLPIESIFTFLRIPRPNASLIFQKWNMTCREKKGYKYIGHPRCPNRIYIMPSCYCNLKHINQPCHYSSPLKTVSNKNTFSEVAPAWSWWSRMERSKRSVDERLPPVKFETYGGVEKVFPWNQGIPLPNRYLLGFLVAWGRYNLTRCVINFWNIP